MALSTNNITAGQNARIKATPIDSYGDIYKTCTKFVLK